MILPYHSHSHFGPTHPSPSATLNPAKTFGTPWEHPGDPPVPWAPWLHRYRADLPLAHAALQRHTIRANDLGDTLDHHRPMDHQGVLVEFHVPFIFGM